MNKSILLFLIFCSWSCVSPFEFKLDQSSKFLVVEGGVFEKQKSWVTLNFTANNGNTPTPEIIRDAEVRLLENESLVATYKFDEGTLRYFTKDELFRGKAGNRYQLEVRLKTGEVYQSIPELMLAAEKVESFSDTFVPDKSNFEVYGKLPVKDIESRRYLFAFSSFIKARICATCVNGQQYVREDPAECASVFNGCTGAVPDNSKGFFGFACVTSNDCWNYQTIRERVLFDDEVLQPGTERLLKLFEVPLSTYSRYFLQINQLRISKEAQEYFKLVDNAGASSGTLFDPVPPLITGNVHLKEDSEEKALGYFVVAGENQYGYYVERSAAQGFPLVAEDPEKESMNFNLSPTHPLGCRLPPLAYCTPNNTFITDVRPVGWIDF